MSKRKQRSKSAADTAKTMSTLEMWQQQMAALKRASQVHKGDDDYLEANKQSDETINTEPVYPPQL